MCERKYSEYTISVQYLNSDIETIKCENYNSSSYLEMLELYRNTKNHYEQEGTCVKINFQGISKDGKVEIMFTKQIINEEELKIKQDADLAKEKPVIEIAQEIIDLLKVIENKEKILNDNLAVTNKKEDVILHNIEDGDNLADKEKVDIFNKLMDIRKYRRKIKNEITAINAAKTQEININKIKEHINRMIKSKNTIAKNTEKIIKNGVENYVFVKEIKYRTFKELSSLRKQLEPKYDKVYYDNSLMTIYCYNKNGR